MNLKDIIAIIFSALLYLPKNMTSREAILILLAIGLQESRFIHRRQLPNGPARSFWQFELGSEKTRGGVWGIFLHSQSRNHLKHLCEVRNVEFHPNAIYKAIEFDDVLAAGCARLLLWTDPKSLPKIGDSEAAWELYANRTWRPGKPHKKTWKEFYDKAEAEVKSIPDLC